MILDEAGQKGTGKWTSQNALDLGVPIPTIDAAVEARIISALKDERVAASKVLQRPRTSASTATATAPDRRRARRAATRARSVVRAGLRAAAAGVARNTSTTSTRRHRADLARRLHHPRVSSATSRRRSTATRTWSTCCWTTYFRDAIERCAGGVAPRRADGGGPGHPGAGVQRRRSRTSTATAASACRRTCSQAQRDYFGAHTYERIDQPRGSSSTPTGPARAATSPPERTPFDGSYSA